MLIPPKIIGTLDRHVIARFEGMIDFVLERPGVLKTLARIKASEGYQIYRVSISRHGRTILEGLLISAVVEDLMVFDANVTVKIKNLTEVITYG